MTVEPRLPGRPLARRTVLAGWTAAALGCNLIDGRSVPLPERNARTLDQLVIHSDVDVPGGHRLLEDLRILRGDVLQTLALPASDEPIHVYVFDTERSFDEFMRRSFPNFPTRRAFFVKNDSKLAIFAYWGDRVAEDLRHETTHGYLHSVVPNIPLWLDEGLAEYFEVPRLAGGLNVPHVQLCLTMLMTQGWRPNMARLETLNSVGEMKQEDYAESWAWVRWMLHGEPELRPLLQQFLASLRSQAVFVPLSAAVRTRKPEAEHALCDYLLSLTAAG